MSGKNRSAVGRLLTPDNLVVVLLFVLLLAWGPVYQKFFAPPPAPASAKPVPAETAIPPAGPEAPSAAALSAPTELAAPSPVAATEPSADTPTQPEAHVVLSNALVRMTLSSRHAGVHTVAFSRYRTGLDPQSPPVTLDLGNLPSLGILRLPGFPTNTDYAVFRDPSGRSVTFERSAAGLRLQRRVTLDDGYRLDVEDTLFNGSGAPLTVPDYGLCLGPMRLDVGPSQKATDAAMFLGIDTLPSGGGEKVRHWNQSGFFSRQAGLTDWFQEEDRRGAGCMKPAMTRPMPAQVAHPLRLDTDWVAVKNKFFVQILMAEESGVGVDLQARRQVAAAERAMDSRSWAQTPLLDSVSAVFETGGRTLGPQDTLRRRYVYFAGPKEYTALRALGNKADSVMEFGMWAWVCKILLQALIFLYKLIPSYGLAIVLLTLIIRILFWPVTHKSTESMKRMQDLQPKMNELRAKFKDKPQKLQQEMMALYREHKVNPMSGCLPMLVQIPVFIALYNVLRSAIELRFAPFLWVKDLSAPENLFANVLPIPLNILPLFMTATMVWQQKLTPSTGDATQQRMMLFMPAMMLVFFYTMPSALVLYWSVNQVAMIIQLLWHRRVTQRKAHA